MKPDTVLEEKDRGTVKRNSGTVKPVIVALRLMVAPLESHQKNNAPGATITGFTLYRYSG